MPELKDVIGKLLKATSKKPGREPVDIVLEVHHVIDVVDSEGNSRRYLMGVSPQGAIKFVAARFIFPQTVELSDSTGFKQLGLDGWFLVPPEDGVWNDHFSMFEKLSEKAQKFLPTGAIPVAQLVVK